MKNVLTNPWSRYLLAAIAGLLLAAAFPGGNIAGLAWVAPAILLAAAYGCTGTEAFRIGYVGGLATALAQFYWLLLIPVSWFPILGWLALSAFLALFPAIWVWLVSASAIQHSEASWTQRQRHALVGAACWVALEMLRARLFGGLPWNLLGVSQYELTPLIQLASVTGVYGVSFLVVWGSLCLSNAVTGLLRQPTRRFAWQAEILPPLGVVVALFVVNSFRLANKIQTAQAHSTLRVTCVQPSIPQTMIWNDADSGRRFGQLLELTRTALTNNPDLLLWPEAALPNIGPEEFSALTTLLRQHGGWMLLGADDVRRRPGTTDPDDVQYFNAAVLLNPAAENAGVYHKRKLVMFGEFVPATGWLPFLKHLTPITGGFTPGEKPAQFELALTPSASRLKPRTVHLAPLICFEDIFPNETRASVDDDTDLLVNLTNDGWFGESAAQWQQAAAAVFRAVENGLPLLRCCNNGLTCWVDVHGNIREILQDRSGSVYGTGVFTAEIPLLPEGEKRAPTFYNRHGDWFGWGCVTVILPLLFTSVRKLRNKAG